MIENMIIYEQPLNELIRACLRLEQLFHQIDHQIEDISPLATRNIVVAIINILHLVDRPDLKAKLAKELNQHANSLTRLENTPKIDQEKLHSILKELEDLARTFIDSNRKIGQNLREIELLNTLRLHLVSPGGGCSFDIPLYHYWLNQPAEERQATLHEWLAEFTHLRTAITLMLRLIRESTKVQEKKAEHGFYQELLDPQLNLKLIRVAIPYGTLAYPEISVGRHFMSVRFYSPNIYVRPTQFPNNLQFWLTHCGG